MKITINDAVILLESLGEEKSRHLLTLAASSELTLFQKNKQLREFISHELVRLRNEIADTNYAYKEYGNVIGVLLDLLNQVASIKHLGDLLKAPQEYVKDCTEIYRSRSYDASKLFRTLVFVFKIEPTGKEYLWSSMFNYYMKSNANQRSYAEQFKAHYGTDTYRINGNYYKFIYKRYDRILRFEKKLTRKQKITLLVDGYLESSGNC